MSDPLILKRCMAALQAKYILTDDEAKGMVSIVLAIASTLWNDPPRCKDDSALRYREALKTISGMAPATQEMTLSHQMADVADAALSKEESQ